MQAAEKSNHDDHKVMINAWMKMSLDSRGIKSSLLIIKSYVFCFFFCFFITEFNFYLNFERGRAWKIMEDH